MEPIFTVTTQIYIATIHALPLVSCLIVKYYNCCVSFNEAFTHPYNGSFLYLIILMLNADCFIGLQTCVVIRRTPSYFLAGADSKLVTRLLFKNGHESSHNDVRTESIRKIQSANNIFFASAGIERIKSYDADALATQACNEAASIQQAAENFARIASHPLGEALAFTRTHWPEYFQAHALESDAVRIAFFGMEQTTPTIFALMFKAVLTSDTTFRLDYSMLSCPGTIPENKGINLVFGQTEASSGQQEQKLWDSNPILGIKKLILAEAKARPDTVAEPIHILRIDAKGPRWIK